MSSNRSNPSAARSGGIQNSYGGNRKAHLTMDESMKLTINNYIELVLTFLNLLILIMLGFFYIAASVPIEDLFDYRIIQTSDNYAVRITPHGWSFYTWGISYVWQMCWIVLGLVITATREVYGIMYNEQPVISRPLLLFVTSVFLLNWAWFFLWDSHLFGLSFGVMTLMTGNLLAAFIAAHMNVKQVSRVKKLVRQTDTVEYKYEIKGIYILAYHLFLNNGLAFYATWAVVETVINFSVAWTFEWSKGTDDTPSIVALSILSVYMIVYFIVEISLFEKYLRFTFGNYIQLFIVFSAILSKNWDKNNSVAIFALVLIEIALVMSVLKLILTGMNITKEATETEIKKKNTSYFTNLNANN